MAEDLLTLVEKAFDKGTDLPKWQWILDDLDGQVIQLEVSDGPSIFIEIKNRSTTVQVGTSDNPSKETIKASQTVFQDVFSGKRRLVDAAWEGDLNARIYHGRGDLYYMISSFVKHAQGTPELY
ncbi:MAG: hypothetical protein M1358_06440 [Chloroflexi bacterium]|nr:hypothetical protein [Chloroflexota bacterium]